MEHKEKTLLANNIRVQYFRQEYTIIDIDRIFREGKDIYVSFTADTFENRRSYLTIKVDDLESWLKITR